MHAIKERKLETFRELGTEPGEWKVAKILQCEFDEYGKIVNPIFKTTGYQFITPFFDSIMDSTKFNEFLSQHKDNRLSGGPFTDNCQVCGHEIKNCWIIIHEERKLAMVIGCVCAQNYPELGIEEAIEIMWTQKYLNIFKDWVFTTKHHIWHTNQFQRHDSQGNPRFWCNGRRYIKKDAHSFQSELGRLDFSSIGKKEMLSLIRRAYNRDLPIPQELKKFLRHKTSLDQYFH